MKELVAHTGFYGEKALEDAALSELPLTLRKFNDSIMETKHKEGKQVNYIYSGGQAGETGKIDRLSKPSTHPTIMSQVGIC